VEIYDNVIFAYTCRATTYNKVKALDVCKGNTITRLISMKQNNTTFTEKGTQIKKGTPIK
jgi:hypothetical protein